MGKQGYISVSITVLSYLACPEWILSSVDKIIPLFLIFLINFQKTWNRCVLIENLYQFFSKEIYVVSNRILIVTSRGCEISWYHTAEHYPTMPVMGERCILGLPLNKCIPLIALGVGRCSCSDFLLSGNGVGRSDHNGQLQQIQQQLLPRCHDCSPYQLWHQCVCGAGHFLCVGIHVVWDGCRHR